MQDISKAGQDMQPAVEPRTPPALSRTLRGGRMTKWKGEVASYAPNVAEITARLAGGALALALATGFAVGSAAAADRYWDPNRTTPGSGGAGTWNLTSAFWSPSTDGVSGPYSAWSNGALDNAIFGGTAGTVTLGGAMTANGLTFNSNGYVLTGGTLNLAGGAPTITANGSATINSVIAGASGFTKAGAGALALGGVNTFAGDIFLNAGNLHAGSDAALGATGNNIFTAAGVSVGLSVSGAVTTRTVTIGDAGRLVVSGGAGSARITGNGRVYVGVDVTMSNDASTYTGSTMFNGKNGVAWSYFTSIGNLGEASSLGAPVTVSDGTIIFDQSSQYSDNVVYIGDGDSSNRNWQLNGASALIRNQGTGTLTITGNVNASGGSGFYAEGADIELLGTLSGGSYAFNVSTGRAITLGNVNSFTGLAAIGGLVRVGALADGGVNSSLGAGTDIGLNEGHPSYTGAGTGSNRGWTGNGANTIANDGTGSLALSGDFGFVPGNPSPDALTLGGSFAGTNTFSGAISGAGHLVSDGAGIWVLNGANSFIGTVTVNNGALRAGTASAFGAATDFTVNGGILDLGGFDTSMTKLEGTGGEIALGGAGSITLNTKTNTSFGGAITGNGDLLKQGTGNLTLTGASTFTGNTTINGGAIALDFADAAAPTNNILSATSTLNLAGGVLKAIGADAETNSQTVDGLNVIAGSNKISAMSGAGGSLTLNLGGITRTGGIVDFGMNAGTTITTSSAALGGWATVNGTDYAKVDAGKIVALAAGDYAEKDNAANWLTNDIISDAGGLPDTAFFGIVAGSQHLGGLKYTAAASAMVNVAAGQTLGVDGTIIVASSVGTANQLITGGQLTGAAGSVLGLQQNGGGTFTIESTIVDNGGATGFTKAGTGYALLSGANTYTGATTLSGGTLAINSVANAGTASAIGQAGVDSSNLAIESGMLRYVGATASTDRGFTLVNGGPSRTIDVTLAATDVTFSGLVTSPDGSGFTKTGDGTLTLANAANDYTGVTTVNGGTLSVNTLADGGIASGIGAASSDSANLVLGGGGRLQYTGGTVATDRGFTLNGPGGRIDVASAASTLTVAGIAAGAGGLTKEGDGTLVLSGVNTYAGNTIVDGGILRAGSAQAFGPSGFMTVNTGTRLELGGYDIAVGGLLGGGVVDLGGNTLTTSGLSSNSFAGRITGTGGFTRSGSWTQVLSGCNNDYTGKTTVTGGGTLSVDCIANGGQASGIGASSNASANLVLTGGVLNYTGGTATTDRGFTLQGGAGAIGVINAATTLTFTGQAVGNGYLRKDGAGTLVLTAANTYAGGTQVTEGILRAGSTSAFGTRGVDMSNVAGAMLDLNNFDNTVGFLNGGGAAGGNIALGSATLTLNWASGGASYAGKISGTGSLIKQGGVSQTLSGCASDYSGSTTINGGVLAVNCLADGGVASSIGMSSANASNLVINGGALRYVGVGGSTDRRFTLGASGGNALDASGTGAINFASNSAVTFAAANTAQTLTLTGTNTGNNKLGTRLTNNGSGTTSLTKSGTGTWILTNSGSTYTGVTKIDGGVLGVDKFANGGLASSLGASSAAASNLIIGNGSTLRYTGAGDTTNRLYTLSAGVTYIESSGTGAFVFTDTGPVTLAGNNQARTIALGGTNAGDNTLAGSIGDAGTGKTILAKNDSGTWVLTGNNSFTGNTVVNGGILEIGGGGTTGSIVSDVIVTGAAALGFNRSDAYGYNGLISGSGVVRQIGSGVTTLAGDNSYTGNTFVNAGTLLVNGDQSAATGQTTVATGGTLGGTGILGGDVAVADGTLSPGSNGAGTLTINGNLVLGSGSFLAMQFGEAGTTGGALNDLIDVKGNLRLDGTLDVTQTAGGSFGPGIYRIVNYTGSLTNNGLTIGTLPSGTGSIQTSVSGQVNLLAGGDNFSFWDGDAGPKFNGIVNGGNGTWQNSAGNNNWTEANGLLNATYSDGTFAIFAGTGGTVTIDDTLGPVTAEGMQFAANGYVINGDSLELIGPQSTIRVGDGTAAGTAYTATINSVLTGNTQLEKTDAGTLVLTGANTYTGGTAINGGLLSISSDANLGAAAGGITIGNGTLHATNGITTGRAITLTGAATLSVQPGFGFAAGGIIDGIGSLTKAGGLVILTGDNTYTGGTTIAEGTLQIGSGGATGSIVGNVANNGALVFNRSGALTYAGAVSGTGSLTQVGAGTLTMTGVSTYIGATAVNAGKLVLESGGQINGTINLAVAAIAGVSAEAVVDGPGSRIVTGPGTSTVGTSGTGTLTVQNGGSASFGALVVGSNTGSNGTLNIVGADSLVTTTGGTTQAIGFGGTAALNILDGGKLVAGGAAGIKIGFGPFGNGTVAVSGAGSQWDVAAALDARRGSVIVSNGGRVTTGSATFAGFANGLADLRVTGAGSRFETTGALTLAGNATAIGSITIADGGVVKVGGGTLAMGLGNAALNIGGAEGAAAAHAGTLDAAAVSMAAVGNRINFNHDDAGLIFSAAISGAGFVNHNGAGTTVLTGNNSYAGLTMVNAGGLYINGDQSAATWLVRVNPGATLGGKGTIGGDVFVSLGGTLNSGGLGLSPGTLTINGDLNLASGSMQNFSFGQANVPGGPLNDLINVGGDLTLGGTLNVNTSAGGTLDPGVYRVFNYAGTLANSGWTVNLPSPDFYVQISINHQVNLVNTAGMALRYWDGDAGPKNDGNIDGGDGTWQAFGAPLDTGYQNWTETGSINAPFQDAAFAVFAGASGTVTVDDSKGAVNVSGMQFITDGYIVTGDAINLVGGSTTVIRVGDGTTGGAGTTATIDAELAGNSQLVKSDMGTLVLAGNNTYAGGTMIRGGVLQVSADANLGAALGGVSFNGGTLRTTADLATSRYVALVGDGTLSTDAGTTLALDGPISGGGKLTKDGAGTLVLRSDAFHGGGTTIAGGTLQLGAGGTAGSVIGDIANNGVLVTNRSDLMALAGAISGSGAFTQAGPGTTVLTGLNSYTGATRVDAGTLLVNGDQSAATGATSVATGATLGGAGTIGGSVSVADGGVLEPGSGAGVVSTLTIKGNLGLAAGSTLNMQFGDANVAGGSLNDLIEVEGNLVLDGTLNVSETAGGIFGAGIYRVINYDGTLADNGLALGSMPTDSDVFLQTSVANQVNLVNRAGLTLNYWDGDAGPKFDGAIAGGDGTWLNKPGNDNWTDASGTINAPYANGSFAIFTGAAGTVTIDNSLGQVESIGMQFATDGYRIEGEKLELTGAQATIRVGDGSTAGAAMTATVAAELSGSSELVKSDLGTLILTGDNTYGGGTSMAGGTLQVAADAALGAKAGGLSFSGGTLRTTADMTSGRAVALKSTGTVMTDAGTSLALNGALSGAGAFHKAGDGTLVLTADSSAYGGAASVDNGKLVVNGTLGGTFTVASGGWLEGTGAVGTTSNSGTIAAGLGGIGALTVQGNYTGNGGRIEIATVLGDDASATSRLVVTGATAGTTQIGVTNRGGLGAPTAAGIKIIDVGGASNGTFTLDGDYLFNGEQAVVAGAYGYRLYKGGATTPADGDWYLRSALLKPTKPVDPTDPTEPLYQPGAPIYETYAAAMQQLSKLGTMQQRIGNRVWGERADGAHGADAKQGRATSGNGIWARIEAAHADFEPAVSTTGANYDTRTWKLQTGMDGLLAETEAGRLVGGVFAQYGTVSSGIRSPYGIGSIDSTGYGLGATLTWHGQGGFYADAQAQVTWFDSDLVSATAGRRLVAGNDGVGYGLSIEAGQRIALNGAWSLTPQVQLAYSSVSFDDFVDAFGADVASDRSQSLVGRFGIAANHDSEWRDANGRINRTHVYGIANLYYDFDGNSGVTVSDVAFAGRNERLYGGIGVGGSFDWADSKYAIYGEAQVNTSLDNMGDNGAIGGTVGFRMRW